MEDQRPSKEAKSWAKAGAYTGLAFILPTTMYVCYQIGAWIDGRTGMRIWYLVGTVLGFAAGLYETMRQADRIERGPRKNK